MDNELIDIVVRFNGDGSLYIKEDDLAVIERWCERHGLELRIGLEKVLETPGVRLP